ncbi:MAG: protein kinase [Elusimicrobia bacterium]|nr:protein kinase [Elusimicrobiota bacterium]
MSPLKRLAVVSVVSLCGASAGVRSEDSPGQEAFRDVRFDLRRLRAADAPDPGTPPGERPRLSGARAVMARMQEIMDRLDPLLERLIGLKAQYAEAAELSALDGSRNSLRREIEELTGRFGDLWRPFNDLRQQEQLVRLQDVLAGGRKGNLNAKIAQAMELEEFYRAARPVGPRVSLVLAEDAAAWESAKQRIASQRRLRRVLLGGGALLVLLAAGFAAYRRRRLVTVRRHPVLSGPAAAPTAGSGPAALLQLTSAAQGALSQSGQVLLAGPDSGPATGPVVLGGNYLVERELGRGGMGVVLEAVDLTLQRRVAVKRMRAEVCAEPKELERFLAEARLVAALKHPNIVEIHTLVREGGELYLVFELVPGRTLGERLAGGETFPPEAARAILRQVASALDYAHGENVIHRDLKPANIMVAPQGVAKVMDFGLAHRTKMTVARVSRVDSFGTMPYMAPEQELGEFSRESDIFALGVCAYEVLAGKLPFEGPNFLAQKRERHFTPLSAAGPGVPKSWDAALSRALAPLPKDRFRSAREFADALDAA